MNGIVKTIARRKPKKAKAKTKAKKSKSTRKA